MYKQVMQLYRLLLPGQRRRLRYLQALVILMAFAELAGVATIAVFMALIADVGQLQQDNLVGLVYQHLSFTDAGSFLLYCGLAVLFVLALTTAISIFTVWYLALSAQEIGAELSARLYRYYLHQPWLFHVSHSSSELTSKIAQECNRVTNHVITPLLLVNAKIVLALVMLLAILVVNPVVALVGTAIFGSVYLVLYQTVRKKLHANGVAMTKVQQRRFKLLNEGFGGIKDTLLLARQADFGQRFEVESLSFGRAQGMNVGLAQAPRYGIELIAFASVIFLLLFLLTSHQGDLGVILPVLSVYVLIGLKLLPALQQIYVGVAALRGNLMAYINLQPDLEASQSGLQGNEEQPEPWHLKSEIVFSNIDFQYPGKTTPALKCLSLSIKANSLVGLVGATGSGKSTVIDLLMGLISPDTGSVLIDGVALSNDNQRSWQVGIGYVPQAIFLSNASIRDNIAFGLSHDAIDEEKVVRAATLAHLKEMLVELPEGLDTLVGERGVQLSGGQLQRIGIARALYDDPDVLVLDEATSALDGLTEKSVMDAIHDFSGKKTVILIAHRLATVRQCKQIFLLEQGAVVESGTYDELCLKSPTFMRMVEHS
ncbi:MAG: HlyD family secretion protein [Candidatus Azotimanducaceae bacterium]|jgi:HlyD family secretion protein